MVLCKYFQQGSCRFGSKCVNEHLDVKQMIKTDVEAVIHGKQWPLSTYGPFRDKLSIPNFIEDQSFEEVRMLCYEAKQKNFFEQFHQQFTKEAMEASNKMNALLQMTPEVIDVLIKVYDAPSDASGFNVSIGKSTTNVSNPFGLGNSSNQGSIFAKSAPNTSAFPNSSNTFTTSNQGLFTSMSAFAPQQQQQQTSIFAQTSKPANTQFVSGNNNTQQNTSIFAQQQEPSNFFVPPTQQQQTTNTTGLFLQNQFMQQPQQNSNLFRQVLQTTHPQQGLFAQASQTTQQQQQVQPQPGLFTQAIQAAPAGQGLFAQAAQQTQNIFGQALQQQQQSNLNILQQTLPSSALQHQQANANIFQQNQPIIVNPQHVQIQQHTIAFQQAPQQTQNTTGQANQLSQYSSTLYSRYEDLTADEIDAFKAASFQPGKIPFNPPPRELISFIQNFTN